MSLFKGLYQETHNDNRIFINAKKINHTSYYYDYCQNLKVSFELYHSIVPENNLATTIILPEYRVFVREFSFPLGLFSSASEAKPIIHDMLEEIPIPFELDDQGDQLRWIDKDNKECSLGGVDDVAERIAGEVWRLLSTSLSPEMSVVIRKKTVVAPERYRAMVMPDYDDDDDYSYA